ncbi:MAG: TonB-dependent receptor [Chitinophagales bacterium]|nr:TonB-dependent receptor [Chitinophagales bacterium]
MKRYFIWIFLCLVVNTVTAQEQITVNIKDKNTNEPVELVIIATGNKWLGTTDGKGNAQIKLPEGSHKLHCTLLGYNDLDTTITTPAKGTLQLYISSGSNAMDEVTIVASTRNNQAIENSPMKIEVLGLEEMNEESGIKPGNIASILGDVSGVQIQQTSATSGNSNVRVQGLDGRYTQILRDGMPLFDGFAGGFGILTIPPLDLKQLELIKGSASTLYGGGAIAGLINLISKRPSYKQELDALVNYTSLKEFNVNMYTAKRGKKFGYNLFAGYTNQQPVDVNKDGFSDLPDGNSIVVHPKLFYYPSDRTLILVGYTGSFDTRKGGDMNLLSGHADAVHSYYQSNKSQRHTGEYIIEHFYANQAKLTVKGNMSSFNMEQDEKKYAVQGDQLSYYDEVSVYKPFSSSDLVAGVNIVGNNYRTVTPDTAMLKTYGNFTAGMFGQYSLRIKENTTIETGLRLDRHNRYGWFLLPRVAVFHRFNQHWAMRAGYGRGYKNPNPLVQQTLQYNTLSLLPLSSTVNPELSSGYNAGLNYKKEWSEHTSLFINQSFFLTQVNKPILFITDAIGNVGLVNAGKPIVTKGFDTYVKVGLKSWELYLGYTYTDAQNTYATGNNFIPLTPRNRAAAVVVREIGEAWRFGLEGSYTGSQYRYDYTKTPGYMFLALMISRNIAEHITIVLNCENLLDYRMSRVESLYTGTISNPTFKPLWAPIDGRVVNLSVRWKL